MKNLQWHLGFNLGMNSTLDLHPLQVVSAFGCHQLNK